MIEVLTVRQELSIPPKISYDQAKGFTLWATRSILSGAGDEVLELPRATCANWHASKVRAPLHVRVVCEALSHAAR